MSEEIPSSTEVDPDPKKESTPEEGKFVSQDAYKQVSSDMHKFKAQKKDLQAKLNELESKLKTEDDAKMAEQGRYKELAEAAIKEKDEALASRDSDRKQTQELSKRIALKQELGNVNDSYLIHANLSEIAINEDGTLDSESVKAVANKFREEHSSLLPKSKSENITNQPSPSTPGAELSYEEQLGKVRTQRELDSVLKKFNRF